MNQLKNQPKKIDYSSFGGTPEKEDSTMNALAETPIKTEAPKQSKVDYSMFGGEPDKSTRKQEKAPTEKEKVGPFWSALYGAAELALGVPVLLETAGNYIQKKIGEQVFEKGSKYLDDDMYPNQLSQFVGGFPESKDETSRRVRVGVPGAVLGAVGGPIGVIGGLIGSQAGQTLREVYGKEGKFEEFGWGEAGAIGLDLAVGLGVGLGGAAAKNAAKNVGKTSLGLSQEILTQPQNIVSRRIVQKTINRQGEALDDIVSNFSNQQLNNFQQEAANLSQNTYTQLTGTDAGAVKQTADNMQRSGYLNAISPLQVTRNQAGTAIQEAANATFRQEVTGAERAAYDVGRQAAEGLTGELPQSLNDARALLAEVRRAGPTPEQGPMVAFLEHLIASLETHHPASTILDAKGNPLIAARTAPTVKTANEAIDLVQYGNQAVNYGSELREQSHRLIPLMRTMREETRQLVAQRPAAAQAIDEANALHARNAEVWGTNYMRRVRFTENPESIITTGTKSSNMQNLKQAVTDPNMQNVYDRAVVDYITSGSAQSGRKALAQIENDLGLNARGAAENLIAGKDPLTNVGGRAAVRNEILTDTAKSIHTGKRPEKVLELMQTEKGYETVRQTLNTTPQGREALRSFERLFLEDFVTSITDSSGRIDFAKASNVFKNPESRRVLNRIGGDRLVNQFETLKQASINLQRNMAVYGQAATKSVVSEVVQGGANAAVATGVLHAIGMSWPVIAGLNLLKAPFKAMKMSFNALENNLLSNPRAVHYLKALSEADTAAEVAKQLPRLINELSNEKASPKK